MARRSKGEGCLIKPNKNCAVWYAQWYRDGKRVRESTGESVKQRALAKLRELMGDSERGLPTAADQRKVRYGDLRQLLISDYEAKEHRSLKTRADETVTIDGLAALDEFFSWSPTNPGASAASITTQATRKFAKERMRNGKRREAVGTATVNRSLALLRRMLYLGHQERKIAFVPKVVMLKEPPPRKGFLEQADFDKLLGALPTHLRPLVAFLYYCGMRCNEALQLDWTQLDMSVGRHGAFLLEAEQAKTKAGRVVPLHSEVAMLLRDIEPKKGCVFDATNLRNEWESACARVGLGTRVKLIAESQPGAKRQRKHVWFKYSGLLVHDLRRSAVRNMVRSGVREGVAMSISGHKTRSVFERYNITSAQDAVNAMQLVEQNGSKLGQINEGKANEKFVTTTK